MKITKRVFALFICSILLLGICGCGDNTDVSSTSSKQMLPGATVVNPNNTAPERSEPHMVTTKYETYDNVIADYDVTEFGADITGQTDSTQAITLALSACSLSGGGTVWMPAGKYLITSNISVPRYVTLRGDWQDPDKGNDYGTIIIADIAENDSDDTGLIKLSASSGVNGLTVYYKNQDIDNVKKYPFTFYAVPGMLASIKNCTIINGYRGIGTTNDEAHEQLTIKNVKGTILKTGIAINNSADVGTIDSVVFSNKYWANAGADLAKADVSKIDSYTKANAEGLYITDAEQQQMYNITLSGFKYGIHFPSIKTRYMGSGSFYKLNITNCEYGIYVKSGTYNNNLTTIDFRWGYNIANSVIEGSQYSIYNDTTAVDGVKGCFKLSGVRLSGATHGYIQENSASSDLSDYTFDTLVNVKTTGTYFKMLTDGSSEDDIQAALDEAEKAGGGIVYLSAGKYTVSSSLSVPANVLLRGSSASPVRIAEKGTVIISEQDAVSENKAESATALVNLDGENAGVSGIFFHYRENLQSLNIEGDSSYKYYPYAIRGNAKGVYATNICIAGATHGIDFTDCPGYVIEALHCCCLENAMTVSGGGIVMNCLQNATVLARCDLDAMNEGLTFDNVFNPVTRVNSELIRVKSGSNDKILNCFGYGIKTLVNSKKAKNLVCINIGADNIGDKGIGVMHIFDGGSATVINSLRYNGSSVENSKCDLKVYNRMAIWNATEEDI